MSFTGFPPEAVDFLMMNVLQDSKSWFDEHRDEYERLVRRPFVELCQALEPALLRIDKQINTDARAAMCRIRRDTRFSKDKQQYRDHMWATWARQRRDPASPGYWFSLEQSGISYGIGFYNTPPEYMAALRGLVLGDSPAFVKAGKALKRNRDFRLCGDCFKRPRYPDEPEEKRQWLERKNVYIMREDDTHAMAQSAELVDYLAEAFTRISPVYNALLTVRLQLPEHTPGDREPAR